MGAVKPSYLIALVLVVAIAIYIKASNPYREFSTHAYWENATLSDAYEVPDEALKSGNRNGPVLMWAAGTASDPEILKVLVDRGAQINEADGIFKGTPLTGAAGYTKYPEVIDMLISLGADINKEVNNGETALMIAARYNESPGIITELIKHGSKKNKKSYSSQTALDIAKKNNNEAAIKELEDN